jgi:hypothetical protein
MFSELVASRQQWIADVLVPWCRNARLADLRLAETDWTDIAGKVDPEKTLWFWAWSRFPSLVHPEFSGIDETREVTVCLKTGERHQGFPDSRRSRQGQLLLLGRATPDSRQISELGPFSLDEIQEISHLAK